jgi:hypothetical protein
MNAVRAPKGRNHRNRRVTPMQRRGSPPQNFARAAVQRPHPRFAWYAGLAVMAAFEIIEWPLAIVMALGHEIAHRAHDQALRDFCEGLEAGA